VQQAPEWTSSQRLSATFEQTVEYEPGKWMTFLVGPESPDWVPFSEISPHLINSIMTTEDSGFFKHHGFISSEFRSALQQNLQRGYFRLGASSISMQMVKNVLLSREKTLSRKLQEMFLTWYLEHQLTKERIMEIYFNVIEFGPGIYGIGRAARHYFGKSAKDLEPQEAAWFSSILPNPKRRYVQYCHANGMLDSKWDAYIKRIMRRMHERGRLTDEEFATATATPLRFSRTEAMPERECMALVKRITTPPQQLAQQSAK
jgi:membrane peptidoglycan carboxypeptidase